MTLLYELKDGSIIEKQTGVSEWHRVRHLLDGHSTIALCGESAPEGLGRYSQPFRRLPVCKRCEKEVNGRTV